MTRTFIFSLGLAAAIAFPAAASAQCGTLQGSFIKTCEQGVQVYRHNSLSGIPAPMTQAEATVKAEEIRAKTARQRIAAQSRSDARSADLRARELSILDFEARSNNQALRRSPFAFSNPGYGYGYGVQPAGVGRIRTNTRKGGPKSRFNANY